MASVTWKFEKYPVSAEACYREIQTLGNSFTPQQVVDLARDESTALHKCFTWNDAEAAEKWRKQEARTLMAHIVYVQDEETKEPSIIRAISYADGQSAYRPTRCIVRNPDEYERMLQCAMNELQAFKRKYSSLTELEEILALID